mgnify:CR=1 FL=1
MIVLQSGYETVWEQITSRPSRRIHSAIDMFRQSEQETVLGHLLPRGIRTLHSTYGK